MHVPGSGAIVNYKTILVAMDFSLAAETVGKHAKAMAEQYHANLTILHVFEYIPPITLADDPFTPPPADFDESVALDHATAQLRRMAENLGLEKFEQHVVAGTAKHEVVRLAREHQSDLIILGSHGRHGISRLLGSTAAYVLHNAPCDVLAIRIKNEK